MIGDIHRGTSFGGLSDYLVHGRSTSPEPGLQEYLLGRGQGHERVEWSETRNLPTDNPRDAGRLMQATAAQNHRVEKPVYHLILSADQGEELTRDDWRKIVDRVLTRLGLEEHQALIVAHNDTDHRHVHLMVNTVHPEHLKVWSNSHDYARIEKILRHLEREMGLREVPGHHYRLPGQERPRREGRETDGERREHQRTGEESWAAGVRFRTYNAFKEAKSWAELERGLAREGLRLQRRGGGLVVTDGKRRVKASRIHRRGSYRWLEKRFGMSFEEWRGNRRGLLDAIDRYREAERASREIARRRDRALAEVRRAESRVEDRHDSRGGTRSNAKDIRQALTELYRHEDVPRVERRLVARARQVGWKQAGREIAERPQAYGRLRMPRVARLRPRGRRRLRYLAWNLAKAAGERAVLLAGRAVAGPLGHKAADKLLFARGAYLRSKTKFDRMPTEALLRDVAMRATDLGVNVVKLAVAPNPWDVVRTAVRSVQLARSASRVLGR